MKLVITTLLCALSLVGCGEPSCWDNFDKDCIAQCGNLGNCGFDPLCQDGHFSFDCRGGDMAMPTSCSLATINADCAASCGFADGGMPTPGSPGWPCLSDPICMNNGRWRFDCRH
jgi:hypothetical protein